MFGANMSNPHPFESKEYFDWFFAYNPDSGDFVWKNRNPKSQCKIGERAGYFNNLGYVILKLGKKSYRAHRVAWLLTHGEWPSDEIDHIDRNGYNNAISNLRIANSYQNRFNKGCRVDNVSGVKGVRVIKNGFRFHANIMAYGRSMFLGSFKTLDEAANAYAEASKKYHCEFGST